MYNTSEDYQNKIYLDSTRHLLKVYLDDVEVESKYILGFKPSLKVFDTDEFTFGSVSSRLVTLKLHRTALNNNYNCKKVKIVTGIIGEEIPFGEFTINKKDTVNTYTVELKLEDYISKFNFNYKNKITFPATLRAIVEDICEQAGVEFRFYFFFK